MRMVQSLASLAIYLTAYIMRSSLMSCWTPWVLTFPMLTNAAPTTTLLSNLRGTPTSTNILHFGQLESCPLPARLVVTTRSLSIYTTTSSNITNVRKCTYRYTNWYSFPPFPATAESLLSFYVAIRVKAIRAVAASRARYLCFKSGALQFILSCTSQPIPLDIVEDIIRYMEIWIRSGLLGLGKFVL